MGLASGFDVYADLDHLYMLNFSVDANRLAELVPPPLRLFEKEGRGFPSVVLPSIKRLRPVISRFPRVDYELFGLRLLVAYDSPRSGTMKGIWFARLVMDPGWVRRIANLVTAFDFEPGNIEKRVDPETAAGGGALGPGHRRTGAALGPGHRCEISVRQSGDRLLHARVQVEEEFPDQLTPGSVFTDSDEALATYNDIAYGFLPSPDGRSTKILQIADPHPDYVAWPLVSLGVEKVSVTPLHDNPLFDGTPITLEPSYFVGRLPRYWRWLPSETVAEALAAPLPGEGSVS